MAFIRDDDELAMAVLALCDLLDGPSSAELVAKARKHAHAVLDRGKTKPVDTPETPEERKPE